MIKRLLSWYLSLVMTLTPATGTGRTVMLRADLDGDGSADVVEGFCDKSQFCHGVRVRGASGILLEQHTTFVLLAAFTSVSLNLPRETPRYFADAAVARRFWREVNGKALPESVWSLADNEPISAEADRAAAFAVRAPEPGGGQAVLKGEVVFARQNGRWRIRSIRFAH